MTTATTYTHADGSPARILIVDDEKSLADLLAQALAYQGWTVATAHNGFQAIEKAREYAPDVVILDIQMPGLDGMETLARLRATNTHLPVLFLTARDAVEDRIAGLRAGADDYVTKPFDLNEVAARIDALLRRSGMNASTPTAELTVGNLVLNENTHEVTRAAQPVTLTNTEYELLRYLMENAGIVLSKSQILDRVWSYDFGGESNVVELYISYLRKKIDKDHPPMIHTVRGAGYILKPAATDGSAGKQRFTDHASEGNSPHNSPLGK